MEDIVNGASASIESVANSAGCDKFCLPKEIAMPEGFALIGLGIAVLLFGYRIKKIAFFIIWFLLGFSLMNYFLPNIKEMVDLSMLDSNLVDILLPIGGGLLLALLGFSIEKLCISGIAFVLVMLVTVQYFGTNVTILIIGAIIAAAAAGVSVMLMKPALIVLTSLAGAYAIVTALPNIWIDFNTDMLYWPVLGGLAAIGAIFQFATTKKMK